MKNLRYVFFMGVMLLLVGCHLNTGSQETESVLNTRTESDGNETIESTEENKGVYYPAVDQRVISEGYQGGHLGAVCLYYGGNIYKSVQWIQPDIETNAVELEKLLGEELGTVYGDIAHWSQAREDLGYIKTTAGKYNRNYELGTLYAIQGYDSDYALCIVHSGVHEDPTEYIPDETPWVSFFFKENDIWLDKGKDLFCERMKMDMSTIVMRETENGESGDTMLCPFEEDVQKQILEALFEGDFVAEDQVPELSDTSYRVIYLCEGDIFKRELGVYENGYVTVGNGMYLHSTSLWEYIKAATGDHETTGTEDEHTYYPAIDPEIVSGGVPHGDQGIYRSYLYYNGSVYTGDDTYIVDISEGEADDLELHDILDEEIGTVYSNMDQYFSMDREDLSWSTTERTLYKIKGYDDAYRLGILCYDSDSSGTAYVHTLILLDKNNDMYLKSGKDFFCERLQLQNACKLIMSKYVLHEAQERWVCTGQKEFETEDILSILEEWDKAEFLPDADEIDSNDMGMYYTLDFVFAGGFHTCIYAYANGYLSVNGIIAKTDSDVGKLMIEP